MSGTHRVHIVGGPGSGKTTLGAALAQRLGTSTHDLDDLALSEGVAQDFRPLRPLSDRELDVRRLSETPSWVTEGSYLWWTEPLFQRADAIIWLDVAWPVAAKRILERHVRSYVGDVIHARGIRQRLRAARYPHAGHLVRFQRWSSHYYASSVEGPGGAREVDDMQALTRAATRSYLRPYLPKVIHLRRASLKDVVDALERTTLAGSAEPAVTAETIARNRSIS